MVTLQGHECIECPRAKSAAKPGVLPTNPREVLYCSYVSDWTASDTTFHDSLPDWGNRNG